MAKRESLLEKRIREYSIPPWPGQAMYGRIIVYRIPDKAAERRTFVEGGVIEMTEEAASGRAWRAPRGIIVSAGLQAMDVLRGNGIGLGDMIWMASHTPWRFEVDSKKTGEKVETVEFFFRAGSAKVELRDGKHQYTVDGDAVPRFDPPEHPDDM
jgi:hypothetical protein